MKQKVIVCVLFISNILCIVTGCATSHNDDNAVVTIAPTYSITPTETIDVKGKVEELDLSKFQKQRKTSEKIGDDKDDLIKNNTQENKKANSKKEESENLNEDSTNQTADSEDKLKDYAPEGGIVLPDDIWE